MNPRLKSSVKWTKVPQELLEQIQEVLTENFSQQAKLGRFIAEGRIYPAELILSLGFLAQDQLKQHNFLASVEYSQAKDNMLEMINFTVDCTASMMSEYFEDQTASFPQNWQEFKLENRQVFLKYDNTNTQLEQEADKILGTINDQLVDGDLDSEELKAKITLLGLDED